MDSVMFLQVARAPLQWRAGQMEPGLRCRIGLPRGSTLLAGMGGGILGLASGSV